VLDLDMSAIRGQARRRVMTDTDAWHWENLGLPAGLRLGPFRTTVRTDQPLQAVGQFGPDGITGRVVAGPFRELEDGALLTPNGRSLAVRLGSDGAFSAQNQDLLPRGQFLASTVLSDRQQRRETAYRQLYARTQARESADQTIFLAWAEPPEAPFDLGSEAHLVSSALLALPLQWEHSPAGTRLTIANAFIPYERILLGKPVEPILDSRTGVDMRLRFQIPRSVLPLQVEQARLDVKIRASRRHFTVTGFAADRPSKLLDTESPVGTLQVNITEEALLHLDKDGGLYLGVAVGDLPAGDAAEGTEARWAIEAIELEVTGRTLPN
jgi:hypothetical protein